MAKTTGKYSVKPYKCTECDTVKETGTNHWGDIYPYCETCRKPTVWECLEDMPADYEKPPKWKMMRLGDVNSISAGWKDHESISGVVDQLLDEDMNTILINNRIPNIDALSQDEIYSIYANLNSNWWVVADKWFPGWRDYDTSNIVAGVLGILREYTNNKWMAISARLKGTIDMAQYYESICQDLYNKLPQWARW